MKKLNNWLFGNSGKVLKVLSVVFFWIEVIASIVVACFAIVDDPEYLIALAGIPVAWLANLMTYGIGCAVENSFAIRAKVCGDSEKAADKPAARYDASRENIRSVTGTTIQF